MGKALLICVLLVVLLSVSPFLVYALRVVLQLRQLLGVL